ncbi:dedicator of cytokinesis protein 1 [Sarotherodon galilaeus]
MEPCTVLNLIFFNQLDWSEQAPILDRVHRAAVALPTEGGRPRPFIVRIHYYQEKERIQRLARQKGRLEFQGKQIFIFPDYSAVLARRRAAFSEVKGLLRKKDGVRYGLLYPARLRISFNGETQNHRDFHTIVTIFLSINKRTISVCLKTAGRVSLQNFRRKLKNNNNNKKKKKNNKSDEYCSIEKICKNNITATQSQIWTHMETHMHRETHTHRIKFSQPV